MNLAWYTYHSCLKQSKVIKFLGQYTWVLLSFIPHSWWIKLIRITISIRFFYCIYSKSWFFLSFFSFCFCSNPFNIYILGQSSLLYHPVVWWKIILLKYFFAFLLFKVVIGLWKVCIMLLIYIQIMHSVSGKSMQSSWTLNHAWKTHYLKTFLSGFRVPGPWNWENSHSE